ncbi:MAG: hypothetical protein B1H11_05475 [Desulfobacteraceae bacterium 4484_190.1]|nr:MAG: hypothetical protein B1H11_05475 [Desulfobacteraceae bacterium 4484_190.1]
MTGSYSEDIGFSQYRHQYAGLILPHNGIEENRMLYSLYRFYHENTQNHIEKPVCIFISVGWPGYFESGHAGLGDSENGIIAEG